MQPARGYGVVVMWSDAPQRSNILSQLHCAQISQISINEPQNILHQNPCKKIFSPGSLSEDSLGFAWAFWRLFDRGWSTRTPKLESSSTQIACQKTTQSQARLTPTTLKVHAVPRCRARPLFEVAAATKVIFSPKAAKTPRALTNSRAQVKRRRARCSTF